MHTDPATATSTAVILTNSRGQYLLHLRDANKPICDPGTWSLIGGGPEGQETPDEAIVRELHEEAGLVIPGLALFTTVGASGPHVTEGRIQVYEGRWDGDADRLPVTEGIMFRWFDVDTMAHLSMCPWAYEAILAHHAKNPLSAISPVPEQRPGASQGGAGAVRNVIGAHLYLERDGRTLLGLRHPDVAFAAEEWHALAGHVERESVRSCLVREAAEEAGLVIRPEDLDLVHTVHLRDDAGTEPRIQLFFRATAWCGEPEVREPDRCVRWEWWPLDGLPEPMVPYTRTAINGIRAGRSYSEMGWT
ncbi:NUDIX domain-containing protein [Streptomyces sp. CB03238]|uniref:NUDIX hydrolase n=1 Tax=Streptomyces sp. CB03238 TaxID=1907777 RepID=UPI000A10D333|nr:NUDIX domain-containing protein [Streptomyces sp. CB03238]ORT60712.1 NUDIX hydrolase [Streptomyces sp. CB03238]